LHFEYIIIRKSAFNECRLNQQESPMTIKAYTLAITIAVVSPLTIAMTGASVASPALSGASELKAAASIALTDVRYRKHAPQYWNYAGVRVCVVESRRVPHICWLYLG
jgi:hypothetical protein